MVSPGSPSPEAPIVDSWTSIGVALSKTFVSVISLMLGREASLIAIRPAF